jgi:hypothetical protein
MEMAETFDDLQNTHGKKSGRKSKLSAADMGEGHHDKPAKKTFDGFGSPMHDNHDDLQDSQFDMLTISIASDDVIRNHWSRGEIKKPETIN